METFKNILSMALAHSPKCLALRQSERPALELVHGWVELDEYSEVPAEMLDDLFAALFPDSRSKVEVGQLVRGTLKISASESLLVIGVPVSPRSIEFFAPPDAATNFRRRWDELNVPPAPPELPEGTPDENARTASSRGAGELPPLDPDEWLNDGQDASSISLDAPPVNTDARVTALDLQPAPTTAPAAPMPAVAAPVPAAAAPEPTTDAPVQIEYANVDAEIESTGDYPIDKIFREMIAAGASDLHLTVGHLVGMRIDGDIVRKGHRTVDPRTMAKWLDPIIPDRNRREFAECNDTDFAYEVQGMGRFRVNLFRDHSGVGSCIRRIPSTVIPVSKLGLPDCVHRIASLSKGLVIVTGPTGSGKSTTLAALIDLVNETRDDHIITIEDPIEFVHTQKRCLIHQREVHRHTSSFSSALRAALREDPDIVLIGELRDQETVATAIETAETGHLVFGTLHTNTAISTVDRLIDTFPSEQQSQVRSMLSESLKAVIAQTLCKRSGGGRVAGYEILMSDRAVGAMIREGRTQMLTNRLQTHRQLGNVQLNQSLLELVMEEVVEPAEAYKKAVDKDGLLSLFSSKGVDFDPVTKAADAADAA